jgi:hypothetical protein
MGYLTVVSVPLPVTKPVGDTLATAGLEDVHVMAGVEAPDTVAVSWKELPENISWAPGGAMDTTTRSRAVAATNAAFEVSATDIALIVAVPAPIAVTTPVPETVTTVESSELHDTAVFVVPVTAADS